MCRIRRPLYIVYEENAREKHISAPVFSCLNCIRLLQELGYMYSSLSHGFPETGRQNLTWILAGDISDSLEGCLQNGSDPLQRIKPKHKNDGGRSVLFTRIFSQIAFGGLCMHAEHATPSQLDTSVKL